MASAGELDITVDANVQGASIVRVDGELDLATKERLEEAIEGVNASGRVIVDLTACTFLDSAAVRALITTARRAQAEGGTFSLVVSDPGLLRVLEIAAVETVFPLHGTLDAAL